jgi:UDPglucose 6-dehydrogenase
LTEVMNVNNDQKLRFVAKVRNALWTLRGKKIAVLGLAFKGGTDDVRDSPALEIVQMLKAEGASIRAYDPAAMERARGVLIEGTIAYASDVYDACVGADAVLVLAEWKEFAELDFTRIRALLRLPILIDGKNVLDPVQVRKAGLHYYGVGSEPEAPMLPAATPRRTVHASSSLSNPATLIGATGD